MEVGLEYLHIFIKKKLIKIIFIKKFVSAGKITLINVKFTLFFFVGNKILFKFAQILLFNPIIGCKFAFLTSYLLRVWIFLTLSR